MRSNYCESYIMYTVIIRGDDQFYEILSTMTRVTQVDLYSFTPPLHILPYIYNSIYFSKSTFSAFIFIKYTWTSITPPHLPFILVFIIFTYISNFNSDVVIINSLYLALKPPTTYIAPLFDHWCDITISLTFTFLALLN